MTKLFINDKKIELSNEKLITFSWKVEDVAEPTVVRTAHSKSVKVPRTAANNAALGALYLVQSTAAGISTVRKNSFKVYENGELVESGYAKIDKVDDENYTITLYDDLADFFHSLSIDEKGNKKKLSDLKFGEAESQLSMNVNKTTVAQAWAYLKSPHPEGPIRTRYDLINFAPALNGVPKDFDSQTIMWDMDNNPLTLQPLPAGPSAAGGVFITKTNKEVEYDEWATGDLRSYLQRPVLSVKKLIETMCFPVNNGGYTVNLDPSFFNDKNPYWNKTWITLPLIPSTAPTGDIADVQLPSVETIIHPDGDTLYLQEEPTAKYRKGKITVPYSLQFKNDGNYDELHNSVSRVELNGPVQSYTSCFVVQLLCRDKNNYAVASSDIQMLTNANGGYYPEDYGYSTEFPTDVKYISGEFILGDDGIYRFNKDLALEIDQIELEEGYTFEITVEKLAKSEGMPDRPFYTLYRYPKPWESTDDYMNRFAVQCEVRCVTGVATFSQKSQEKYRLEKTRMLNTRNTPLDYLLSYCKMFGLMFIKSPVEKKIDIVSRNTFYSTGIVKDITDKIDRKTLAITSIAADKKWYEFRQKVLSSSWADKYLNSRGVDYGNKRINTNYDYDDGVFNLLSKSIYNATPMVRTRTQYNVNLRAEYLANPVPLPPNGVDGINAYRYNENKELEENPIVRINTTGAELPQLYNAKYYSRYVLPVLEGNGSDVLLMLDGFQNTKDLTGNATSLRLTDDTLEMEELNGGKPCWYYGKKQLAVNELPVFSRYITNGTNVSLSLNMGDPEETFTYDYSFAGNSDIYSRYWMNFIRDQYDKDTRIAECSVLMDQSAMIELARTLWFFDGGLWALIDIKERALDPSIPVKCRFIKIKDTYNYTGGQQL